MYMDINSVSLDSAGELLLIGDAHPNTNDTSQGVAYLTKIKEVHLTV